MNLRHCAVAAAALLTMTGAAQAALFDRSGGMVYDDTLNITWLKDWNYAQTSGYTGAGVNANGMMNWDAADNWANNLVYGGHSDWRLPTSLSTSGPCGPAYGCSDSEMGHMFYVDWGAAAGTSVLSGTNAANLALFKNVKSDFYWSGTAYAPDPSNAWAFYTYIGFQNVDATFFPFYAVAVRNGDVAAVPEPQTYAMLLLGLGAVMGAARRRRPVSSISLAGDFVHIRGRELRSTRGCHG